MYRVRSHLDHGLQGPRQRAGVNGRRNAAERGRLGCPECSVTRIATGRKHDAPPRAVVPDAARGIFEIVVACLVIEAIAFPHLEPDRPSLGIEHDVVHLDLLANFAVGKLGGALVQREKHARSASRRPDDPRCRMSTQFLQLAVPCHASIGKEAEQSGGAPSHDQRKLRVAQALGYGRHVRSQPLRLVLDALRCLKVAADTGEIEAADERGAAEAGHLVQYQRLRSFFGGHHAGAHAGETGADHDDVDLRIPPCRHRRSVNWRGNAR